MAKKVFVGLSGGVDSSVAAALLKEQGYEVIGVYMKNWTQDIPGFPCPWKEDFLDAKRVAVQLGIDFKVYDFQKQYRNKVVDYMIDGFKAGITPNPDIMCNQEVKFKLFLQDVKLLTAKNNDKYQTFFLYRVDHGALEKTLFPVGEFVDKKQVREIAKKLSLLTADKKDSQGICFVGKVGIKEFLQQFVETKPGNIIDQDSNVIGEHDGAIFYTIGQRHGLNVGGGLPYYVTGKDIEKNEVYVTTDLNDKNLWRKDIKLTQVHWINNEPDFQKIYYVRTRYRAPLVKARIKKVDKALHVKLLDEVRAITPGQSIVIYDKDTVLGGGIII
jgi:tRNA-specific 2-thiouridylase